MSAPNYAPPGFPAAAPPNNIKVVASRQWWTTKIALGSVIIIFDLVLISIASALLRLADTLSGGRYYSYTSYTFLFPFIVAICPAILSICWQIAEFITVGVHKDRRGIHPGAHVALHLLCWLGFLIDLGFLAPSLSVASECYVNNSCSSFGYTTSRNSARRYDLGPIIAYYSAIIAFMAMLTILHFTLFVRFCIECDRRNKMGNNLAFVYYMQPGPNNAAQPAAQPLMGYQPYGAAQLPGGQQQHAGAYGGYYAAPAQMPAQQMTAQQMPSREIKDGRPLSFEGQPAQAV